MLKSCRYHDKIFKLSCLTLPAHCPRTLQNAAHETGTLQRNDSSIFIGRDGIVKKPGQPAG